MLRGAAAGESLNSDAGAEEWVRTPGGTLLRLLRAEELVCYEGAHITGIGCGKACMFGARAVKPISGGQVPRRRLSAARRNGFAAIQCGK